MTVDALGDELFGESFGEVNARLREQVGTKDFDPSKHPRGGDSANPGRFSEAGGTSTLTEDATTRMLADVPAHGVNPTTGEVSPELQAWLDKYNGQAREYQALMTAWTFGGTHSLAGEAVKGSTEEGRRLAAALDQAPVMDHAIFRGLSGVHMEPGFEFQLPPSSFTHSHDTAEGVYAPKFAPKPAVLELVPGAHAAPVEGLSRYPEEREVISGGHFRVVSSEPKTVDFYGQPFTYEHVIAEQTSPIVGKADQPTSWWRPTRPYTGTELEMAGTFSAERDLPGGGESKEWDPEKHPRGGNPENRGQFSSTGGAGEPSGSAADLGSMLGTPFQDPKVELQERVRRIEPKVTNDMESVAAAHGGYMYGLQYRFKEDDSLERKIGDYMRDDGLTRQQAVSAVKDALRYTIIYDHENYTGAMMSTLATLNAEGYVIPPGPDGVRNYWAYGDTYQGTNVHMIGPENTHLELQFHTPESIEVKFSKAQEEAFHEYRLADTPYDRKVELWNQMVHAWDDVPVPQGVMSIGVPMSQPGPRGP